MKKYTKKTFEDGTEYIETTTKGYPDWWSEFKKIVETSPTLKALMFNLVGFKPVPDLPQDIHGQLVFNPFLIDFLISNPKYLETFNKGHKKGEKHFKRTYFKKHPNERESRRILDTYNNKIKQDILKGFGTFNNSVIAIAGFENGILTAYWHYEDNHLREFEDNYPQNNNPHPDIFTDKETFEIFKKWMGKSQDESTKKISFIVQRLKQDDSLRKTNCKELSQWAFENQFIDQDTYDLLLERGHFDSPNKILTKKRLEQYDSLLLIK